MKRCGNKFVPEIGKCFKSGFFYSFTWGVNSPLEDVEEVEIGDDVVEHNTDRYLIGDKFIIEYSSNLKRDLVNKIFSNDDQIAIMLNYQESKTNENKEMMNLMQGWRDWFSGVIANINDIRENKNIEEND